jgi:hypothetical protein
LAPLRSHELRIIARSQRVTEQCARHAFTWGGKEAQGFSTRRRGLWYVEAGTLAG